MDAITLFHRSFVDVTDNATAAYDTTDLWSGRRRVERVPVAGSYPGFQWLPKDLRPIELYAKPGQEFKKYATQWEQNCSILATGELPGYIRLDPVVHPNAFASGYPVVAHYGKGIRAEYMIAPREYVDPTPVGRATLLRELLERDVPVYVTAGIYPRAGAWRTLDEPYGMWSYHDVVTNIEGRVLARLGGRLRDNSIERADPLMILGIASLVVSLGRAALSRVVLAMVRRNIAKEAAQSAWKNIGALSAKEQQLIKDVATAKRVLIGRTGGNRTGTVYGALSSEASTATILDEWLRANGLTWSQRWQDVFNHALYERTKAGFPVEILAGGPHTAGEAAAAEAGAAAANPPIKNVPYWPKPK